MSLDGPYAGKQDRIAEFSFMLANDTLASFMKFYTSLHAVLNSGGFNPHSCQFSHELGPMLILLSLRLKNHVLSLA
jgi:hypothetical protein